MCKWGTDTYVNVIIPEFLSWTEKERGHMVKIDSCIAPVVDALNREGILTFASCCGHYKDKPFISCQLSDNYEEKHIVNALIKNGWCGFSLSKIRHVTSKKEPLRDGPAFHFWRLDFWNDFSEFNEER